MIASPMCSRGRLFDSSSITTWDDGCGDGRPKHRDPGDRSDGLASPCETLGGPPNDVIE
jgi:hypothetical protein